MNRKRGAYHRVKRGEYMCNNVVLLFVFRGRIRVGYRWRFKDYM